MGIQDIRQMIADLRGRIGRRRWLGGMGLMGLGAAGLAAAGRAAPAQSPGAGGPLARPVEGSNALGIGGAGDPRAFLGLGRPGELDAAVLNFALNLEYLEGEYYLRGVGSALPEDVLGPDPGPVNGGTRVPFANPIIAQAVAEIGFDELAQIRFLRANLGPAAISRPAIDFVTGFTLAARAAGLIGPNDLYNPFADDISFLLGAFTLTDVGVTAYRGGIRLLGNRLFVDGSAGILATESFHIGLIRTLLINGGPVPITAADAISNARDALDGPEDLDQGLTLGGVLNFFPTDPNGLALARTPQQVLRILYQNPNPGVSGGGFFPAGVNGPIRTT
jgi:hypothetical protein